MANAPQLTVGLGFDLDEASAKKVVKGMERVGENLEKSAEENSKKVSNSWSNTFSGMVKGFIAVEVAGRALGFAKDLIMLEERFKNMQMPLKNLTEQTGDFSNSMFFLKGLANNLGQDIFTLSDAYKGIYASGKQAGMATDELNKIFQAVIRSGSALKLSNEKIELTMKAIEQMMNKGVIGAEELRQQLGDHLPGAYAIMAKAAKDAGLSVSGSTAELGKLLEDGKLASNVVLPFFAKRMEEAFGKNAEANVNTLSGSANRLKNELTYLVVAMDDSRITSFWASFKNGLADTYHYMSYVANTGTFKDLMQFFTGGSNMVNVAQMFAKEKRVSNFSQLPREKQMPILKQKNEDLRTAERTYNANIAAGIKMDMGVILRQQDEYQNFLGALKSGSKGGRMPKPPANAPKDPKGGGEKARHLVIDLAEIAQKSKDAAEQLAKVNEKIAEFNFQQGRKVTPMGQARKLDNTSSSNADKKDFFGDMLGISGVDLENSTKKLENRLEVLKDRIKGLGGTIQEEWNNFRQMFSELDLPEFPSQTKLFDKLGINVLDGINDAEIMIMNRFMLMQDTLKNVMFEIGNSLGELFTGIFESVFDKDVKFDFKKVLASFLKSMGQMLISMGTAVLAAGKLFTLSVLTSAEGVKSIKSGLGLIALGGALSAGGNVLGRSGDSPSQNKEYDSTFTAPAQGSGNQNNKVEFVIQGTTLKGVLNNVNNSFG